MEKQRLLYQQARLHNRGAAEMVLQMISACKGALHKHPAPPEHTHPVFTLLSPHFLWAQRHTLPPLHACGLHTHPSPCMFHLPCDFLLILPSRSHFHTPPTLSLTSPASDVFWWMESPAPKLSGPSFVPCSPPHPAGETGAMVSSTLKLGISILNGGNANVQQVAGEGTWEEG